MGNRRVYILKSIGKDKRGAGQLKGMETQKVTEGSGNQSIAPILALWGGGGS